MTNKKPRERIAIMPEVSGKRGGKATLKKYGVAHYKRIARKRWQKMRKKKRSG